MLSPRVGPVWGPQGRPVLHNACEISGIQIQQGYQAIAEIRAPGPWVCCRRKVSGINAQEGEKCERQGSHGHRKKSKHVWEVRLQTPEPFLLPNLLAKMEIKGNLII